MIPCSHCGEANPDQAAVCQRCGAPLTAPAPQERPAYTPPPYGPAGYVQQPPVQPPPQYVQGGPPAFIPTHFSQGLPQPAPYLPKRPFTWTDVSTVLGFVSSVAGFFWASVLLLPLGLVASILGFRGDKTRGLAVAGIVISVIGLLIKLMVILDRAALLPNWFTSGIW